MPVAVALAKQLRANKQKQTNIAILPEYLAASAASIQLMLPLFSARLPPLS